MSFYPYGHRIAAIVLISAAHDVGTHQAHLRCGWTVEKAPYNSSNHL